LSALQISRVILCCDGCAVEFNGGESFPNPTEARGSAYGAGWRFPPRLTKNGKASASTSDVCPDCLPGWTPQPISVRPSYRRADGSSR
jgi:hypothetical protein